MAGLAFVGIGVAIGLVGIASRWWMFEWVTAGSRWSCFRGELWWDDLSPELTRHRPEPGFEVIGLGETACWTLWFPKVEPPYRRWSGVVVTGRSELTGRVDGIGVMLWTAMLLSVGVGVGLVWSVAHRRRRSGVAGCPTCGYDLAGLGPGKSCPECGKRGVGVGEGAGGAG